MHLAWNFSAVKEESINTLLSLLTFIPHVTQMKRLGIDDIALVLQHVLRKEDDDWVKKCMEYEV